MRSWGALVSLAIATGLGCSHAHAVASAPSDGDRVAPPDAGRAAPPATITLLSPQSTALVSTPTPTLRFRLPAGLSSAQIEVCADRGCRDVRWSSETSAPAARVGVELPPGPAFWRVHAHDTGGADVSSPTWVFRVGHRRAPVDTSWLLGWDSNGDGVDDVPLGWFGAFACGGTGLATGRTGALDGRPCTYDMTRPACLALGDLQPAGDVDGDGFADALAHVALPGPVHMPDGPVVQVPPHVLLFRGREACDPEPVDTLVCTDMAAALPLGDVDGDGFADVAVRCGETWRLYRGSDRGLLAASDALRPPVIGALDVNGDGLPDVLTGDGLRLGVREGLGGALDVAPMRIINVAGALARADGTVDFAAAQGGRLTAWDVAPGEASRVVQRPWSTSQPVQDHETLVAVGDLDGDGFDDVAKGHEAMGGWVQVLPCGPRAPKEPLLRWTADPVVTFGTPVALGDVNGDGYDDLGVRDSNDIDFDEHVYLGGPRGLTPDPAVSWQVHGRP